MNASHHYLASLPACPWCNVETATGVVFFSAFIHKAAVGTSHFNIQVLWAAIDSVLSPGQPPRRVSRQDLTSLYPSDAAKGAARVRSMRAGSIIFVFVLAASLAIGTKSFLWVFAGLLIGWLISASKSDPQIVGALESQRKSADADYQRLANRWEREAGVASFDAKKRFLMSRRDEWNGLSSIRQSRLTGLEQQREKAQLQRFLEKFDIEDATISGVGPGRKAMLASYSVETAWDVTDANIMRVPGFGPAFAAKLGIWRREVEKKFRYDRTKGVDPRDIAKLDKEIAERRMAIEVDLVNGASDLRRLSNEVASARVSLGPQMDDALKRLVQFELDLRTAKG